MKKITKTIRIDEELKINLDSIRSSGQSYNGLIRDLIRDFKRRLTEGNSRCL
jgi:predicted CopG family antitoxin